MAAPPFASFYFDCDSTLASIEGIDELAASRPESVQTEIRGLTEAAMDGAVPLETVYERRLSILAPTRADLDALGRLYVARLVPGAREVLTALLRLGKTVGIVSGGLLPAVRALEERLGVPREHVHAVPVHFHEDDRYAGFDAASPLWRSHGKVELLKRLRDAAPPLLYVGDGVTDLEARDVVDLFVGFGGVAHRPAVAAGAHVFRDDGDLRFVLDVGLTDEERERLRA